VAAIAAATAFLSIAPSSSATDVRSMAQADERARNERLEATETSVRSTLTSLPPLQGIEPQALECRSSTCRLELIENVPGVLQAALPLFAARMAHALTGMSASTVENGNADVRVVLYLSR
jgi:hypothetical protein